jgi:hypothetical protein
MRQAPAQALAAGLVVAAATVIWHGAAHAADAENGRLLAQTHCSRCHVVPGHSSMSIGITPSFQGMADRDDWYEHFIVFYTLRPHPSFVRIEGVEPLNDLPPPIAPIHLTLDEVADITAFAESIAAGE